MIKPEGIPITEVKKVVTAIDDNVSKLSGLGEKSHDRQGGDGLSTATFSHQTDDLIRIDVER